MKNYLLQNAKLYFANFLNQSIKHIYFYNMLHIGKLIKEKLKKRGLSVAEFALKINTNRNNVYNIFERTSIDTEFLYKISIILSYDFFKHYNPLEEKKDLETADGISKKWLIIQFDLIKDKLNTLADKKA